MSVLTAWLAAAVLTAQALPPELAQKKQHAVDPALPPELRPAVERAIQAELDPKRGAGNAMEILQAEEARFAGDPDKAISCRLRYAGVVLRSKFVNNLSAPEDVRYLQALSTYSKMDVTDPGLAEWIDRTIKHVPAAKPLLDKKKRRFSVAVSAQGSGLEPAALFEDLAKAVSNAGFTVTKAPFKEANYSLKIAALEVRTENERSIVRVTAQIEALEKGKPIWRTALFRTMEAREPKAAQAAAVEWLIRIGGRDLLFDFLERNGLKGARMPKPGGDHHDHDHGAPPGIPVPAGPK